MTAVGRVTELWRYPVKSMGGEIRDRVDIGPQGIPGDRGWALRDDQAGEIRGAKKMPALRGCHARYDAEPSGDENSNSSGGIPARSGNGSSGRRPKIARSSVSISAFSGIARR